MAARFSYLGPEATFTEQALRSIPGAEGAQLVPCATVAATLDGLRRGYVDGAMVPLENSVEGSVSATLDQLTFGDPLVISREVVLPVNFALMARPGTTLADVTSITTHPHAHAQCRRWLATHLPQAQVDTAGSTAGGAALVAAEGSTYDAAIAAPLAAERYGLTVLATGIGDDPDAVTRFVLVTRPAPPPAPTGADRTTLALILRDDRAGALLELLTELAIRGINLTRIESRPAGGRLGRYYFSIDCEGHIADQRVGEALAALRRNYPDMRYLGSYPRADGEEPTIRAR